MIRDFTRTQEHVQYVDVASAMFDPEGKVRADLFVEDGLHPAPKCYALWMSIIKPLLLQRFGLKSHVKRERQAIFSSPVALIYHSRLEPNGVPSVEAGSSDVLK